MTEPVSVTYYEAGTHLIPGDDGLKAYAEAIDPIFDVGVTQAGEGTQGWIKTYQIGSLLVGQAFMTGGHFVYSRDQRKVAALGLDVILVQVIEKGGDLRFAGAEGVPGRPGDVCVVDMMRTFRSETSDCTNLNLALPRNLLPLSAQELDGLHGVVLPGHTVAGQMMAQHIRLLWGLASGLSADEIPVVTRATLELLTALSAPYRGSGGPDGHLHSVQLMRVRRHIEARLGDGGLGPARLCRDFGLSRASLYRLFTPLGGVSDYIRERRLQQAFTQLADPALRHKTMGQVAQDNGFTGWAVFARAFRSRFQMTPGEVRELGPEAVTRRVQTGAPQLPDWLRQMDRF